MNKLITNIKYRNMKQSINKRMKNVFLIETRNKNFFLALT